MFSFLDFDEAGGDFEPGEDDVEVVEGVGGSGVGDGVAVGAGVELLGEWYRDWETDRKSTRLNSSHSAKSRMPSSA